MFTRSGSTPPDRVGEPVALKAMLRRLRTTAEHEVGQPVLLLVQAPAWKQVGQALPKNRLPGASALPER